ncbi:MAG TPA: hypothetical protein VK002_08780, partial [Rubricoccaceae bacterium]|nr:hypothetical protein [Rubricoccaceae bacterium]
MDPKLSPALTRRLAAYSATAGIALVVAPESGAQVVYHDLDPDVVGVVDPDAIPLDFDDDGLADLELFACYYHWAQYCNLFFGGGVREPNATPILERRIALQVPEGGAAANGAFGYFISPPPYGRICASRLSSGDLIGAVAPPRGFYSYVMAASSTYYGGPICVEFLGAKGYAGFRFVGGDGELHYGWLRLAVTEQADVATVAAYAYEATPDTPITAGDR